MKGILPWNQETNLRDGMPLAKPAPEPQEKPAPPASQPSELGMVPLPEDVPTPEQLVPLVQAHVAKQTPAPDPAAAAAAAALRRDQTDLCYTFEEHLIQALPALMVQGGRKDAGWPGCWVVIGKITETPDVLTALQEVGVVAGKLDQLQQTFLLRLHKALADKGWRLRAHTLDLEVDLAIRLVLEPFPLDALQALPTVTE